MNSLKTIARKSELFLVDHSPSIMVGLGISLGVTGTILAIQSTPKALTILDNERKKRQKENIDNPEKLKPTDVVRLTWKLYVPTIVSESLAIACIIGANSIQVKRNASIATACTLSNKALKEYREQVIDTIGDEKEKEVEEKVAKKKLKDNPVHDNEVIITDKDDILCLDSISQRYFMSTADTIRHVQNELNARIISEMYVSLNDFYYALGIPPTPIGDDLA